MTLDFIQNQQFAGIEVQFWDFKNDEVINLTGYSSGYFTMNNREKTIFKLHETVTDVDLANGIVKYVFQVDDLANIGNYAGQFTINGLGAGPLKLFTPEIVVAQFGDCVLLVYR